MAEVEQSSAHMNSIDRGGLQRRQHRFANCPVEMRLYAQWVVWKYVDRDDGKPTKVLFSPKTGLPASVTNPNSWDNYDNAVKAFEAASWNGIGFVFTKADPYAGIDLDDAEDDSTTKDRQDAIYDAFESYAEISPSGKGLHIIIKGNVQRGRRRSKVEIYSSERYFTMTGNVYRDAPIAEFHTLLNIVWHQMGDGKPTVMLGADVPQTASDIEIVRRALNGGNGSKFHALHIGRWQQFYGTQSEADFAYIDMLAYWSRNREQISRLFLASPLGARPKAQRADYRNRMIDRAFDRFPPPIDIEAIQAELAEAIAAKQQGSAA